MFGKYYLLPPRAAPPPPLLREGEKLLPLERDGLLTAGVEDEREGMVAVCRYEERVGAVCWRTVAPLLVAAPLLWVVLVFLLVTVERCDERVGEASDTTVRCVVRLPLRVSDAVLLPPTAKELFSRR